jgi:hypothetical protein
MMIVGDNNAEIQDRQLNQVRLNGGRPMHKLSSQCHLTQVTFRFAGTGRKAACAQEILYPHSHARRRS